METKVGSFMAFCQNASTVNINKGFGKLNEDIRVSFGTFFKFFELLKLIRILRTG